MGTPITNTLCVLSVLWWEKCKRATAGQSPDISGYLHFTHFRPWKYVLIIYPTAVLRLTLLDYSDWSAFNQHIAKVQLEDALLAGMRAQGVLKLLLLRRTKHATIDGQPILELPAKQVDLIELEFEYVSLTDSCKKRSSAHPCSQDA